LPTLRTAHSLFESNITDKNKNNKIQHDIFKDTLLKNYPTLVKGVDVFTGLNLYEEILNARNSNKSTREKFQSFEDFLSENFFENKTIDIVAEFKYNENKNGNNESEQILINVEGEKDRYLYELGDGIQALIILMYKVFMAEGDSFIFIDEPEINLHPGMQRLFLEQITSNEDLIKKNLTYFISTHSNHFLDLTIEKDNVSIYSFTQKLKENGNKHFVIKNVNSGDNDILKDLGVNNSSVFMANCSIWVEGISDRNYIKAFLKSYCDYHKISYPKEDIDFAFFEYAGSNINHYIFDDKIEKVKVGVWLERFWYGLENNNLLL
jgi:predicted ATPase